MQNNLRILMAKEKKTLSEISKNTGISINTLSSLKREISLNPDSQTLIKIAKYFDITLDDLVPIKKEGN